jgi:hypothetical protein
MIEVVRLWNTLMDSAKTGTSGYQSAAEFNRDLASVQTSAMGLLAPKYAANMYVQELLAPFVMNVDVSETKPDDCFYFLGATINDIPATPITPLQASIIQSSPIRNPSAKNPSAYFYLEDGGLKYIHSGSLAGTMQYVRQPEEAAITLTPVSDANRDYLEPTSDGDLEWPESAFNLILALMQQKLGVELKEDLLMSVGQLGLQFETSKA